MVLAIHGFLLASFFVSIFLNLQNSESSSLSQLAYVGCCFFGAKTVTLLMKSEGYGIHVFERDPCVGWSNIGYVGPGFLYGQF
jgi:hypothetical protein